MILGWVVLHHGVFEVVGVNPHEVEFPVASHS